MNLETDSSSVSPSSQPQTESNVFVRAFRDTYMFVLGLGFGLLLRWLFPKTVQNIFVFGLLQIYINAVIFEQIRDMFDTTTLFLLGMFMPQILWIRNHISLSPKNEFEV